RDSAIAHGLRGDSDRCAGPNHATLHDRAGTRVGKLNALPSHTGDEEIAGDNVARAAGYGDPIEKTAWREGPSRIGRRAGDCPVPDVDVRPVTADQDACAVASRVDGTDPKAIQIERHVI